MIRLNAIFAKGCFCLQRLLKGAPGGKIVGLGLLIFTKYVTPAHGEFIYWVKLISLNYASLIEN